METRFLPAHLNHVREERSRRSDAPQVLSDATPATPDTSVPHPDKLASRLFGLMLTDNGPDPNTQVSKLWESRADYQEIGPSKHIITSLPEPLPIADIADSLLRLKLDNSPPAPPAPIIAKVSKKDRNQHSVKALKLISNIKAHVHKCSRLLLDNSGACIAALRTEMAVLRSNIEGIKRNTDFVKSRKQDVTDALDRLALELQSRDSTRSSTGSQSAVQFDSSKNDQPPIECMDIVAQVALVIGVVCSIVMGMSQCSSNFIIGALSLLLYLAFQRPNGSLSLSHEGIIRQIPTTIESVLARFNLTCKTTTYATCSCHYTYPPSYPPGSDVPVYPEHCTHRPKLETQCSEPLLDMKPNGERHPKKAFVYNQFNDYLAGLLSRRDIETMMDEACDNLLASLSSPQPRFVKNPFEAKFLREFSSPKSGKLFIDRGEEGRYAFALHVDFFNPEGMNLRGASTSSGIISMACLNLLLNIRYKPENMYLAGIIPGPKQPSLENLNHYVHPLILDLATSWERGVWYSRTANHPNGRLTCCAIALAVCDLPAARHLAVLAGVGSHFFCSACSCYHTNNYGRVDFENWVPRDPCELHTFAEQWRDATTTAHCEKIFREHGVR
ncbi:hypothetical protein M404DRAFT_151217 [Pisolithus tinctorius Marx 270]|uniref:Uncharacterized protein n=1 Tax=Pisolithus tinctorius Marx 270 TaxID=870435 RepID=A0A0C3JUE3_PISTI|nr:hypothetical protein M404DRAFT_151217 [Pisolithus tinctorius Marx 270]